MLQIFRPRRIGRADENAFLCRREHLRHSWCLMECMVELCDQRMSQVVLMHMRILRSSFALSFVALLAAAFPGAAVGGQSPAVGSAVSMPAVPLLPERFGPWQAAGAAENGIVLDPAVAKELIVRRTDARRYTAEGNAATISAVQLSDSTGAYSAWTLLRTPQMRACAAGNTLGSDCAVSAGKLLFWQGNTLVSIAPSGTKAVSAGAFEDLLTGLPKPLGAKGAPPLLPTRLPAAGLQKESTRYAVGPATYAAGGGMLPAELIDFSKSPEILTTRYAGRGGSGVMTAIFYPTPTIAGARQHAMEQALANDALPAPMRAGAPAVRRSGPIVALASSGFSKREAVKLAEAVRYEAQLTWNKPEGYMDQFTIVHASNVIVQIIILVITVVLAALVLGIVFGGGRALIRKARGKPASSLEDAEIIRLDLRGPAPKIRS